LYPRPTPEFSPRFVLVSYFRTPDPYRDIAQVETVDALRRVMLTAGVAPPQGTPIRDREGSSPEAALRPSP
jgi:hypothetical protein